MTLELIEGISIVIPCYQEEGNIERLAGEIDNALDPLSNEIGIECIWVDDASQDATWLKISEIVSQGEKIKHKGLRLGKNSGQTTALMAGIDHATYEWIVTIDGDCQNDPTDIPKMIEKIDTSSDVICGQRYQRKDKLISRKLPSLIANWMARVIFSLEVKDLGCTLRLFNRKLLQGMRLMGEMHRTLTIFLRMNGGILKEIPVNHRKRVAGKSKYGAERIFKFSCDVILARFYYNLRKTPLYLFAAISLVISTIMTFSLVILKFLVEDWMVVGLISIPIFSTIYFIACAILLGLMTEVNIRTHIELDRESQYSIAANVGL